MQSEISHFGPADGEFIFSCKMYILHYTNIKADFCLFYGTKHTIHRRYSDISVLQFIIDTYYNNLYELVFSSRLIPYNYIKQIPFSNTLYFLTSFY